MEVGAHSLSSMFVKVVLRLAFLFMLMFSSEARGGWSIFKDGRLVLPSGQSFPHAAPNPSKPENGTRWALLIAGSSGYGNYRHQADVCHAYQLLHKDGLKDENIVVMMYDDIAYSPENPHPGTIINRPGGMNVYENVPKDYTGLDVNGDNFLAVLRGDGDAVAGIGSGKVIDSGPNDHVFVFFSDHGGPGVLGMPNLPFLYAKDIIHTLKAKHAANGYKELVFYLEACESGSIFEGLLPGDMNIFATTAANSMESSWGCYCPGMEPSPPFEYETCLGDLYSISWMEDSDVHNLRRETLKDQYKIVKARTSNYGTFRQGSHAMKYGEFSMAEEPCERFLGTDPANDDAPQPYVPRLVASMATDDDDIDEGHGIDEDDKMGVGLQMFYRGQSIGLVAQRDAEVLHAWHKYKNAAWGSSRKAQALADIDRISRDRQRVDSSVALFAEKLVGVESAKQLSEPRPAGLPVVDDWDCLKDAVRLFEMQCGLITQYGMKHMRVFANVCNAGHDLLSIHKAAGDACKQLNVTPENVPLGLFSA